MLQGHLLDLDVIHLAHMFPARDPAKHRGEGFPIYEVIPVRNDQLVDSNVIPPKVIQIPSKIRSTRVTRNSPPFWAKMWGLLKQGTTQNDGCLFLSVTPCLGTTPPLPRVKHISHSANSTPGPRILRKQRKFGGEPRGSMAGRETKR